VEDKDDFVKVDFGEDNDITKDEEGDDDDKVLEDIVDVVVAEASRAKLVEAWGTIASSTRNNRRLIIIRYL
jgi:hypothetical protein